jgi:hypothetical protein
MINTVMKRDANVAIAAAVAAGTLSGHIVPLGAAGLFGIAETDRFVAANYTPETALVPPPGLEDGEATVILSGISQIQRYQADGTGLAQYVKAYWNNATRRVTATSAGNTYIGYTLDALAANAFGRVGIMANGS